MHLYRRRWKEIPELVDQLRKVLGEGQSEQWNEVGKIDRAESIEIKSRRGHLAGGLGGKRVGVRKRSGQLGPCGLEALVIENFTVALSSCGPGSTYIQPACDILPSMYRQPCTSRKEWC